MEDILAGKVHGELNIHSKSTDARARLLSALANRPFEIDGQMFSSVEGFYQGIRFAFEDPRRRRAFASSYGYAQQFHKEASGEFVWWKAEKIHCGSARHIEIIELAIRESFYQNPDRMKALLDTRGLRLRHLTGKEDEPNSPLPAETFCKLLSKIRDEALAETKTNRY